MKTAIQQKATSSAAKPEVVDSQSIAVGAMPLCNFGDQEFCDWSKATTEFTISDLSSGPSAIGVEVIDQTLPPQPPMEEDEISSFNFTGVDAQPPLFVLAEALKPDGSEMIAAGIQICDNIGRSLQKLDSHRASLFSLLKSHSLGISVALLAAVANAG